MNNEPPQKKARVGDHGQGHTAVVSLAEIHPHTHDKLSKVDGGLETDGSDAEDSYWKSSSSEDTDYCDDDEDQSGKDLLAELQSDAEEDSFIPFPLAEAEAMRKQARSIGYKEFIKQHLQLRSNILRLMHAFDFPLVRKIVLNYLYLFVIDILMKPEDAFELPEGALWSVFANCLRRFCQVRFKLPHLNTIDDAVDLIKRSSNILVLTGAGISVSCGIPDFRSENGLYSLIADKYPDLDDPQLMFDIHYFRHNPNPFFELAKEIFPSNFRPSPTHWFIRLLERQGKLLRNYTQNIDTLESAVGLERVVHCHGSFDTATCQRCKHQVAGSEIKQDILAQQIPMCTKCVAVGNGSTKPPSTGLASTDSEQDESPEPIMKPDIVFFGENLPEKFDQQILLDRDQADLMIIMGSSLKVAPVSELVGFIPHSVPVILINREPVYHLHHSFDVQLLGYCDQIVKELCRRLGWQLTATTAHNEESESANSSSNDDDENVKPPAFIPPHIYLFEGAKFDQQKHQRALLEEGYCTSADEEEEDDSSDDERPALLE
jgi:NAD-dependent SIR2 family protein deacetylase